MKRAIITGVSIILLILFQLNIINFIGDLSFYLNPLLIIIILVSLLYSLRLGLIWALAGGFLIDLYSIQNFGTHVITFVLMIILVHLLFKKFITNRSFYSFLFLTIISTIFYHLILMTITPLLHYLNFAKYTFILNSKFIILILIQILLNSVIITIIYLIISSLGGHLKTNFITKEEF